MGEESSQAGKDIEGAAAVTIKVVKSPLHGRVVLPGSKSITNRALLLAGMARGKSCLTDALKSDDTYYMTAGLRQMGVVIHEPNATRFVVESKGKLEASTQSIFLGNAGTATRFLVAAAATIEGKTVIDGDSHMRKRPIAPLVYALRSLGVKVDASEGCPPVTVYGIGGINGGKIEVDAQLSSQYVSALLMVAPKARNALEIKISGEEVGARGYIDLTIATMCAFGASVEQIGVLAWRVQPTGYHATNIAIEPDASATTYLWAAEVLTGGSIDIGLSPQSSTQPDANAHRLIAMFPHLPPVIDGSQIQDAVPTLAVLAAFNEWPVRFNGLGNLRVKECNRLTALATELCRIRSGLARVEDDSLIVHGDPALKSQNLQTNIETYQDHRIAMAFAIIGLRVEGITILDPGCVGKTFPNYWQTLRSLGIELEFHHRLKATSL